MWYHFEVLKVFLLDLEGLRDYWNHKEIDDDFGEFIYICLRGQVKGESGARCHILPCVPETTTGINVKASIRRLMKLKSKQGYRDGPAISDTKGFVFSHHALNDTLTEVLVEIYGSDKKLFPDKIKTVEDIKTSYQVFRSLR